jgi:NitT/TauT family transport system substrate-binding protein
MRTLFRLLAVGFAAILAGPLAAPAEAATFKLITTDLTPQLVPNSVMDLAVTLGYFKREGVDVELVRVQQTPSAISALMAGEGDMANIAVDSALQLVARNQMKIKAVLSPDKSLPYLVAAKNAITTVKGLEGKNFGIGRVGSLDHTLTMMVMRKSSTDPDKVQYVGVGQPADRASALMAGAIDATTVSIGVWLSMPKKDGLHILVDQPTYYAAAPVVAKVNVVRDEVLQSKRAEITAVTTAIIKASRDFATNPKIWVDAMVAARPDVKRADLEMLAEAFKYSWSVNGGLNKEELMTTQEADYQGPDYKDLRKVGIDEWVDLSIIQSVLKSVGVSSLTDKPTG